MNKNLKLKYGLSGVGKDDIWPKQNENTAPLKETSPLENYVSAQEALLNKGDFAFSEKEWLKNVKDSIKNYDNFSYDVNSDALYQQLVNQYVQQGKMASADVMGKAAGMTGGYGNSYANTVGNQVYQSYIQQLNNEIPALYESALNQHNMKKQALYDEYALLMNEYDREYGLYADEYSRLLKSLEGAKELEDDNNSSEDINNIRKKLDEFKSNTAVETYLENLEASGKIDREIALMLMSEYMDINEGSYDEEGKYIAKSYTDMAKSTAGWIVVEDGGNYIGSLNDNMKLEAPNGEKFTISELFEKLKEENSNLPEDKQLTNKEIKEIVKKLQNKL